MVVSVSGVLLMSTFGMRLNSSVSLSTHAATPVMLSISMAMTSCSANPLQSPTLKIAAFVNASPGNIGVQFSDECGTGAMFLSWITNVWATTLIGCKTW